MDKDADSRKHAGVRRRESSPSDPPGQAAEVSPKDRLARRLTYMGMLLGLIAALVGAGHLAAWLGGYLSQRGLRTITMKTNAALCLTLVGVALMLLVPAGAGWVRRRSARICAGVALLVGVLTLVENLSGRNLGISQLLATETPGAMGVISPNQMGLPASVSFTLLGPALLLLSRRDQRGVYAVQVLALPVCAIALLPTIGFLYEARVRVRRRGRYVGLAVCDRGRGFDPQDLRQTAGFGLLSIRERVELLGGRMTIRSAPGQGSTFRIVVPDSQKTGDRR